MRKFEYGTVDTWRDGHDGKRFDIYLSVDGVHRVRLYAKTILEGLNELGTEGWEVISDISSTPSFFYVKREVYTYVPNKLPYDAICSC